LNTIATQSTGKNRPSRTAYPAGVCIQLFAREDPERRHQRAECDHAGGEEMRQRAPGAAEQSTPRKLASRRTPSGPRRPAWVTGTLAVASEKRDQLVPNWNGITMPVTTPMPNATEKMRVQNEDIRSQTWLREKK